MNVSIASKVIVITGCTSGIGRQIALHFAKESAVVIANVRKYTEEAERLWKELHMCNPLCLVLEAEVTNKKEVEQLLQIVLRQYSHVDILINNAGISDSNLLFYMTENQWNEVINTNLNGVFLCSKIFGRQMIKQRKGKIINIASVIASVGEKGLSNYAASKAGVIAFTKSIAKELDFFNVMVNAVCPGRIITGLGGENIQNEEGTNDSLCQLTILLNFLVYMSADVFGDINGQVFHIDTRIFD